MEKKNSNGQRHDLVFCDDHTSEQVAVAEIKFWWGGSAEPVYADVRKLTGLDIPSIMLVLTTYQRKNEANPFEKLATELHDLGCNRAVPHICDLDLWETHRFEIMQWPNDNYLREFAVAGSFITPPEERDSA
jgi:hypothetical protein